MTESMSTSRKKRDQMPFASSTKLRPLLSAELGANRRETDGSHSTPTTVLKVELGEETVAAY